jgi:hypothetical protein
MTFAGLLGVAYAGAAYALAGIHWAYGSVAALLVTLGGLLPDLDSPTGVQLRGFTGILGVLAALAVWQALSESRAPPAFEYHLWAVVATFVLVRHGLRRVMTRISVHRGVSHSLPACAVWGALAYLHYPVTGQTIANGHTLRLFMAVAVAIGFLSHLILDEVFSVDLRGARVNRAFGTALKLWGPSPWANLGIYAVLFYLTWRIRRIWPEAGPVFAPPAAPIPPFHLPDHVSLPEIFDVPPPR